MPVREPLKTDPEYNKSSRSSKLEWWALSKKDRSERLKREASKIERAVWRRLQGGVRVGREFWRVYWNEPIGRYFPDFYVPKCGLVVEIDGRQHYETEEARNYDQRRDHYLTVECGLAVMRFMATDAWNDMDGTIHRIERAAADAMKGPIGKRLVAIRQAAARRRIAGVRLPTGEPDDERPETTVQWG